MFVICFVEVVWVHAVWLLLAILCWQAERFEGYGGCRIVLKANFDSFNDCFFLLRFPIYYSASLACGKPSGSWCSFSQGLLLYRSGHAAFLLLNYYFTDL
jgi:hypothetical protein